MQQPLHSFAHVQEEMKITATNNSIHCSEQGMQKKGWELGPRDKSLRESCPHLTIQSHQFTSLEALKFNPVAISLQWYFRKEVSAHRTQKCNLALQAMEWISNRQLFIFYEFYCVLPNLQGFRERVVPLVAWNRQSPLCLFLANCTVCHQAGCFYCIKSPGSSRVPLRL